MRVAYVTCDRGVVVAGRNGAATHVRGLVTGLVARGADVTVLSSRCDDAARLPFATIDVDDDRLLHGLRREGSPAADHAATHASELRGLLLNPQTTAHLEALHRIAPLDVVYERQSLWSTAGLQFARRHGIPFFLEVNAPLVAQQAEYRALANVAMAETLSALLLAHADRVVVPSAALAAYVVEHGARAGRVRVVPCGVARARFLAQPPDRPARARGGPFTVGFLGSLKPWHGIEILLDAFAELRRRSDAYRLLVVGDGPLRASIEARCAGEIRDGLVTLSGAVPHDEVPTWLARMDVGVAPYPALPLFYFSPLKVFEYAAAGVPIVASGQIAELLVHREHALLHGPGRIGKIVKHVELLRATPDLGTRLARRARHLVRRRYTWDRMAARVLAMAASSRSSRNRSRIPRTMAVMFVVMALGSIPARAGVTDTPLPIFSDAHPAQLVAVLDAIKHGGLETEVICTNLGGSPVDIGLELFDAAGTRANTVNAGNGALLAVPAGSTVTIASGNTAVLHEDATIALEPPVVDIGNGSGRVVASSSQVGCVALGVDRLHTIADPGVCPTCAPPAIVDLPVEAASITTTTTSSTVTTSSSTTTAPSTTSTTATTAPGSTTTSTPASTTTSSSATSSTTTSSSTSSSAAVSTTTVAVTSTTLPACAALRGLDSIACFCEVEATAVCPAAAVPRRVATRLRHACAVAERATAVAASRRRQRLTTKAVSLLGRAAGSAARGETRGTVPPACAKALTDAASRAGVPVSAPLAGRARSGARP